MPQPTDNPATHSHSRVELILAPIPQPYARRLWCCGCGAVEFDTYPLGGEVVGTDAHPVGRAWVTAEQLAEVIGTQEPDERGTVA